MPRRPDLPCADCGKLLWRGTSSLPAGQARCRPCRRLAPAAHGAACLMADCERPSVSAGLCSGHRKRQRNGQPLDAPMPVRTHNPSRATCEVCGTDYRRKDKTRRSCSRACGLVVQYGLGPRRSEDDRAEPDRCSVVWNTCTVCSTVWPAPRARMRCSADCRREHSRRYANARYEQDKPGLLRNAHRRRTLIAQQWVEDVDINVLIKRDRGICQLCHTPVRPRTRPRDPLMASIDHIVPVSLGGEHSYANTWLSHYRCNLSKHNRMAPEQQLALVG